MIQLANQNVANSFVITKFLFYWVIVKPMVI